MATATSTFSALFMHLASDLTTYNTFGYGGLSEVKMVDGAVIKFANGRLRAITGPGSSREWEVTLPFVPRADVASLDDYLNVPILLKDGRGRIMYGQFFTYSIGEEMLPGATPSAIPVASVSFTFKELTLSWEV